GIFDWTPKKAGNYRYGVHIKDKESEERLDSHRYSVINVLPTIAYQSTYYNRTFKEVLDIQMTRDPQTDLYGKGWQSAKREDVAYHLDPLNFLHFSPANNIDHPQSLQITASALNVRRGPSTSYNIVTSVSRNEIYTIEDEKDGWYKITANGHSGWIAGWYTALISYPEKMPEARTIEVTGNGLRVRSTPVSGNVLDHVNRGEVYTYHDVSSEGWYKITTASGFTGWISNDHVKRVRTIPNQMYQFLVLSGSSGISASNLNNELRGKGILDGKGQAFIEAGRSNNINEIYLLAHALLETGNGTSDLATGIRVDKVDGKSVTPRVVYNIYGIGAFDGEAKRLGAEYAYKQGWFTPEDAIIGGAKWIADRYTKRSQDTLYKMRWNPINPGYEQYATDIGWATKQTRNMDLMLEICMRNFIPLQFNIPIYKK
ncbi:SH3 domain-containing protein, partial [Serpentinicella sp. ANB-PHB4]|uniref:SH3 domain-containing protein n=1 Tax=Serpentinicella sp. ANB-PHB4 TaxID=3074076 RepID=UPI0028576A8D